MWGSSSGQRRGRRPGSLVRSTVAAAGVIAAAVTVGLVGTGGTYALWNTSATVPGATLSTGTIGLTIDGGQTASFGNLAAALGPGDGVAQAVTLVNTGTTPLTISASSTTGAGPLASYLTLALAPVAATSSCSTGVATGAPLVGYTTADLFALPGGASQLVCVALTLPTTAPATAAGQTADIHLAFTGTQS